MYDALIESFVRDASFFFLKTLLRAKVGANLTWARDLLFL